MPPRKNNRKKRTTKESGSGSACPLPEESSEILESKVGRNRCKRPSDGPPVNGTVTDLERKILKLIEMGEYTKARKKISIESKMCSALECAALLMLRARVDWLQGHVQNCHITIGDVLELNKLNYDKKELKYIDVLFDLGDYYAEKEDYQNAIEVYKLAKNKKLDEDEKWSTYLTCRLAELEDLQNEVKRKNWQATFDEEKRKEEKTTTHKQYESQEVEEEEKVQPLQADKAETTTPGEVVEEDVTHEAGEEKRLKWKSSMNVKLNTKILLNLDANSIGEISDEVEGYELECSMVDCSSSQSENFADLQNLCNSHPLLLSILHRVPHPKETGSTLIVCEPVYEIDRYFELRWNPSGHTLDSWWKLIGDTIRTYFRDVIRTLLFLYHEKKVACGKLSSNFYITSDGHARILPSFDAESTQEKDFKDVLCKLNHLVKLPFGYEFVLNHELLPGGLVDLMTFWERFDVSDGRVPFFYIIDHPSLRSRQECINYIFKLGDLVFKDENFKDALNSRIGSQFRVHWGTLIKDPQLQKIYQKGNPGRMALKEEDKVVMETNQLVRVKDYSLHVDILRFCSAVHRHADQRLSDLQIEHLLNTDFPKLCLRLYESTYHAVHDEGHKFQIELEYLSSLRTEEADFEKW